MLPRHNDISIGQRVFEGLCIASAVGLLLVHVVSLARTPTLFHWWLPAAIVLGAVAADLISGLVHWSADTWGSVSLPVIGRRFLHPFRVHHVNPDDFLRRDFWDTNGDVAFLVSAFLIGGFWIPVDAIGGAGGGLRVALVSFCAAGLPTNQVHQWAHRPRPPRWVAWFQSWHVILSRQAHLRHHRAPYAMNYCIATGWCNGVLNRLDFFRRLERVVTTVTGLQPRADDGDFQAEVGRQLTAGRLAQGTKE